MLLRLIPLPPQPTIHFSLTLPTFPAHLEAPQSYTAQINHLLLEDLEVPITIHSLDKSVGLMSLLEEVIFEIKDGGVSVTCRFVDGAVEEWVSTEGTALISALQSILHNVQDATLEDRQSQLKNSRSRGPHRLNMPPAPTPLLSMTASKPKHKKQRSLFMQIVSSIVPSSLFYLPTFVDPSNPDTFDSPPPFPTSTSPTPTPTPPSTKLARLLRRTARSSLVNTYRRYVLPELTRRFPKQGGFGVWILHSMKRRALERMQALIQESAGLQLQQELRQPHEHEERDQQGYHQERCKSPIRLPSRLSMEEGGHSATTILSFSHQGRSTKNDNESANFSRNGNNEQVEDDLETITDGSSVHTPSSTSHIGTGFMGGSCDRSPLDSHTPLSTSSSSSTTTQSPPSNPHPHLPPNFHFEYTQLYRLRQRLQSLIVFADSQIRIEEDEKRNRDQILLVRGRRRAWLNGELGVNATTAGMQWGFATPFKSSPLARYSWSASAELDESTTVSASPCLQDEEDEDEYDEFHGPRYAHGRRSRRSRYLHGGKLLPVTEEFEYEYDQNGAGAGDPFCHRDDTFFHLDEEDVDCSLSDDGFSLGDPRELELEVGFGEVVVGEDGEELLDGGSSNDNCYSEQVVRGNDETSRIAFEMERPKIIPRVRDGLVDDDSMFVGGGTKNSGDAGRYRSWKNGIGIGLGSRGRSLYKTCRQGRAEEEEEEEDEEQRSPRFRQRTVSISSTSSTSSSTSSMKSQRQQQHRREPAQVEMFESDLGQDQDQDQKYSSSSSATPLLFQPVSFAVSHGCAVRGNASLPHPARAIAGLTPATIPIPPPNDTTTTSSTYTTANSKDANSTIIATTKFVPTTPISFTTRKLCMGSATPNVYAGLDVSVFHVGDDDDKSLKIFGSNHQRVVDPAMNRIGIQTQMEMQGGVAAGRTMTMTMTRTNRTPRFLRPRRHKREYQYQRHVVPYGNDEGCFGRDDGCEYELAGYGQFDGYPKHHQQQQQHQQQQHVQQRHHSMIHARLHLDELLLEEGCGVMGDDAAGEEEEEEFTLAMDVPLGSGGSGSGGGVVGSGWKRLRRMPHLQNCGFESQQPSPRLQHRQVQSLPSSSAMSHPATLDVLGSHTVTGEFGERS